MLNDILRVVVTIGFSTDGSTPVPGDKLTELTLTTSLSGSTTLFEYVDTMNTTDPITGSADGANLAISGSNLATSLLGLLPHVVLDNQSNTFTVSPQTIVADADAHKGLVVKAHSGTQSANLQEWQDSGGTAKTYLDSGGHLISKVHASFGNKAQLDTPYAPDDFRAPVQAVLLAQEQVSTIPASGEVHSTLAYLIVDPPANVTNTQFFGLQGQLDLGLSPGNPDFTVVNPHNFDSAVAGVFANINHWGSGTVDFAEGLFAELNNLGGGTINTAVAGYFAVYQASSTGSIVRAKGIHVDATFAGAGATITNAYGVYVYDQGPGGGSPGVVNHWNIYSTGSTSHNTFEGSVLAGTSGINNAAAVLQADSTTKGFLPPRMTTTQRDAISSPPEGLVLYNTTSHKLTYRNASTWVEV